MSRSNTSTAQETNATMPPSMPTLGTLARETLDDCDGDTEKATAALSKRLLKDTALLRMVIEQAVRDATYSNVQGALRSSRASLLSIVANPPKLDGTAIAAAMRRNLLDFALAGGLRLGDATKGEVLAQVKRYEEQAGDMAHKARWLKAVADATPARKTVGAALSAERVEKLFEETRK